MKCWHLHKTAVVNSSAAVTEVVGVLTALQWKLQWKFYTMMLRCIHVHCFFCWYEKIKYCINLRCCEFRHCFIYSHLNGLPILCLFQYLQTLVICQFRHKLYPVCVSSLASGKSCKHINHIKNSWVHAIHVYITFPILTFKNIIWQYLMNRNFPFWKTEVTILFVSFYLLLFNR